MTDETLVARLASENERLRAALKKRVVTVAFDPDTTQYQCELCGSTWFEGREEVHEPECLLRKRRPTT